MSSRPGTTRSRLNVSNVKEPGNISSGTFLYGDGSKYEGEFKEEGGAKSVMRHGEGRMSVPGHWSYQGQWLEDGMNGKGKLEFSNGCLFEGTFKGNQYYQGTYNWPDGSSYTGEWKHNKMNGNGKYIDIKGEVWTGVFAEGSCQELTNEFM